MASWIWAASPFDLLVDKATSPNLPIGTEDIATSLEIADQIRAKSVLPKAAVASLKRKVGDKNPNVQKLSFGLIDCCIKNGGDHFLVEVAARDFIDNLASILRLQSTNAEVKRVGLDLFQQWALAFQSKPELNYVCEVYRGMKDEGVSFPPPPAISNAAALLSTSTAPAWVDSEVCLRCRTPFSFTNRKHHCRNCGKVFDQGCSSHLMPLPHFGIVEEVRVCDGCWGKSKTGGLAKQASILHAQKQAAAGPAPAIPRKSHHPDSDLARAIALSLAEAQASSGANRPGFVPTVSEPPIRGGRKEEGTDGEEDEDLRAAIEASLKEMRDAPSAPVGGEENGGEDSRRPYVNPNELTPRETDAILTFSQTIEQAARQGEPDLRRYPHAHELYGNASGLRGKLGEGLNEAGRKEYVLNEMQGKLSSAVKLYDQLLSEQHAHSERQRQQYEQQRYQQQQSYGGYAPYGQSSSQYGQQPPYQGYGAPQPPNGGGWENGASSSQQQQQHPWAGGYPQQQLPYGQPNPWGSPQHTPTPQQQQYHQQPPPHHSSSPFPQQQPQPSSMYPSLPSATPQANESPSHSYQPTPQAQSWVPQPDANAQAWAPPPQQQQQQQYVWDPNQHTWVLLPPSSTPNQPQQHPPFERSTSMASSTGIASAPPPGPEEHQSRSPFVQEQQQQQPFSPAASNPYPSEPSPSTPVPSLNPNASPWTPASASSTPTSPPAAANYPPYEQQPQPNVTSPPPATPYHPPQSQPHDPYAQPPQPQQSYPSQPTQTPSYQYQPQPQQQQQQQQQYPAATTAFPSVPNHGLFPEVPTVPFERKEAVVVEDLIAL